MSNEKFQNKYRSTSIRLQNWDYGWRGKYFVTICTSGREHSFGEIIDGKMQLSPVGVIADVLWHELKTISTASNWRHLSLCPIIFMVLSQ